MEPKVAVIVPVYNMERYLRECLDSLVGQTFKDIEIICFNDASTDSSIDILREYAARDERFVIIDSPVNIKQGGGRNAGIRAARAPYIMFVDPDDWVEPDFVEKYYTKAVETGADIVVGDINISKNGSVERVQIMDINHSEDSPLIKRERLKIPVYIVVCFYKKSLFFENDLFFPENIQLGEDNAISYAIFLAAKKIVKISAYLYYYRIHSTSSCHAANKNRILWHQESAILALGNLKRFDPDNQYEREIKFLFIKLFYVSSIREILASDKINYLQIKEISQRVLEYISPIDLSDYFNSLPLSSRIILRAANKSPLAGDIAYRFVTLVRRVKSIVS